MNARSGRIKSGGLYELRNGELVKAIAHTFSGGDGMSVPVGRIVVRRVTRSEAGMIYHTEGLLLCADGFLNPPDAITGVRLLDDWDIVRVAEPEHPQLEFSLDNNGRAQDGHQTNPCADRSCQAKSAIAPMPGNKKRSPRRDKKQNDNRDHPNT